MIKKILSKIINIFVKNLLNKLLERFNYLIIFRNGSAIGDHIYMSSIIREIFLEHNKKILLFTNYYEFYLNNPRIYLLFRPNKKSLIWFFLKNLKGKSILEFDSLFSHQSKEKHFLYYHKKKIHLAEAMSQHFNLKINYKSLKNEIFFTNEEIKKYENDLNLPKDFALIHSTSKKTFTKNKEWKVEGMQEIVNYFLNLNWIQLGKSNEPRLRNCKHLFDLDFRKVAYVVSRCSFLVTYEGFFNHIASCFEKKNFLIHVGFLPEESFFYKNNIVIENNKNIKCYPCYYLHCENHRKLSKNLLNESFVIKKIEDNLNIISK